MSFSQRVNNTCRPVHFHNKALCQVRKLLPDAAAKTVTCAMVAGRFDYCDALCSPVWYFICECDHRFLSPATLISDNSAVSVLTSTLKQPVPSLHLLSTLNLTSSTVTLSTTIFLNLKLEIWGRARRPTSDLKYISGDCNVHKNLRGQHP